MDLHTSRSGSSPLVILTTVPLAVVGALLGLWLTGQSLNIIVRSAS